MGIVTRIGPRDLRRTPHFPERGGLRAPRATPLSIPLGLNVAKLSEEQVHYKGKFKTKKLGALAVGDLHSSPKPALDYLV